MRDLAPVAAIVLSGASMLGCSPSPPPKVPAAEPLVVGKSPSSSMPLALDDKAPAQSASRASARGPKAPFFSLDSLNTPGKATLTPGKVVIVDFWATWCEPCKKAFPKLQELYVKYKASGLEVVAISVDDEKGPIAEFARRNGAKFPIGWDDDKAVTAAYDPRNMPTTIIVDREGNIAHVHAGYHDGEELEIEREIKALL